MEEKMVKMKRFVFIMLVALAVAFVLARKGGATITNPDPSVWADDDGTELFIPGDLILSFEAWDFGDELTGSSFGFFFGSYPGSLITIFGPEDEATDWDPQVAVINFDTGVVWDFDDGVVQSVFTPNPGDSIGFFFSSMLSGTLYTVASMNTPVFDAAATFPSLSAPTVYLVGFEWIGIGTVAFEVVSCVTPVPEPGTLLLFGAGLVSIGVYGYRKRRFGKIWI